MVMRITQDHLKFWREKKVPTPAWMPKPKGIYWTPVPLIHYLINQQVETSAARDKTNEVSNQLATLRLVRKRSKLAPYLADIASSGHNTRRVANARKWLKRIALPVYTE